MRWCLPVNPCRTPGRTLHPVSTVQQLGEKTSLILNPFQSPTGSHSTIVVNRSISWHDFSVFVFWSDTELFHPCKTFSPAVGLYSEYSPPQMCPNATTANTTVIFLLFCHFPNWFQFRPHLQTLSHLIDLGELYPRIRRHPVGGDLPQQNTFNGNQEGEDDRWSLSNLPNAHTSDLVVNLL